jgi:hypothetical protein
MLARFMGRRKAIAFLFCLGGIAWELSGHAACAQVITTPKAGSRVNSSTAKNTQALMSSVKAELRQARKLLQTANHDYGGHLEKAVKALRQAVQLLSPHKQQTGQFQGQARPAQPGQGQQGQGQRLPGQPGQGGNALQQAASDNQLKQAAQAINAARSQLASLGANPQVSAALPHLQNAVDEIQLALNFSLQKQQKRQQQANPVPK